MSGQAKHKDEMLSFDEKKSGCQAPESSKDVFLDIPYYSDVQGAQETMTKTKQVANNTIGKPLAIVLLNSKSTTYHFPVLAQDQLQPAAKAQYLPRQRQQFRLTD